MGRELLLPRDTLLRCARAGRHPSINSLRNALCRLLQLSEPSRRRFLDRLDRLQLREILPAPRNPFLNFGGRSLLLEAGGAYMPLNSEFSTRDRHRIGLGLLRLRLGRWLRLGRLCLRDRRLIGRRLVLLRREFGKELRLRRCRCLAEIFNAAFQFGARVEGVIEGHRLVVPQSPCWAPVLPYRSNL